MLVPGPTERGIYCGSRLFERVRGMFNAFRVSLDGAKQRRSGREQFDGVNIALDQRLDTVGGEDSAYVLPQDWQHGDHTLDNLIARVEQYARLEEQYKSMQGQANHGAPAASEVLLGGGEVRPPKELIILEETVEDPDGLLG